MKKQWIFGLLLLLVAAFLVYRFAGQNVKEDENVVKIGAILPKTHQDLSQMASVEEDALRMAVEELNKTSTVTRYELLIADSKGKAAEGVSVAKRLIDIDKVDILLTSTTGVSKAVKESIKDQKKNLLAFCIRAFL